MNALTDTVTADAPHVFRAIVDIQGDIALTGIAKNRKNPQQGYSFRGIDDIYQALAPLLVKHRLCILPRVQSVTVNDRISKKDAVLIYTTVTVEYDLVSAVDGSKTVVKTIGEAMDSGDKSANKAQSAAYKYMAIQAFCIPTEGDNDTENTTHDVAAGMTPQAVADHLAAIEAADTVEALKRAWVSAEQIAKAGADVDSYKRFKAAMQKRYEILKQEEPA